MLIVNIDGLCEPVNPGGIATYGIVIKDEMSGRTIVRRSGFVGRGPEMSNNVAEYAALCEALRLLLDEGKSLEKVEVRSDSRLLVNQMAGNWKLHGGLYTEKYREARDLAGQFKDLAFKWIPREENEDADTLTRDAYDRVRTGGL